MAEEQVLFAGFGGQGILSMAKFLAYAAMNDGKQVAWVPSYGPEMRGGTANCLVTISDDPIASPLTDYPDMAVILNNPSLTKFENKVKTGGTLLINTSLVHSSIQREDLNLVELPVSQLAEELGNARGDNMILVGACLQYSGLVKVEQAVSYMDEIFAGKSAETIRSNREAFLMGAEYIRENWPMRVAI